MNRAKLVIMLKVPRAGQVKTRLGREIGMTRASWWFRHQVRALLRRIEDLSQVFTDPDSRANLSRATDGVLSDNFYQSLKALRALLPREDRLFAHGSG